MKEPVKKTGHLMDALYIGSKLSNIKAWKQAGAGIALVSSFLSALTGLAVSFGWIPTAFSDEVIMQVSSVLVMGIGAVLWFIQVATTNEIGFERPEGQESPPEADLSEPANPPPGYPHLPDPPVTPAFDGVLSENVPGKTRTVRYTPLKPPRDPRGLWGEDR